MPTKATKKKASTKKGSSTTFKKGNTARLGKSLTDDEKLLKKQGKYKIMSTMHEVLFTNKSLHELANNTDEPAIVRGLAQMGIRIAAEGQLKDIEMVMNTFGISTKNSTTEATVSGTYPDFLAEVAKKASES